MTDNPDVPANSPQYEGYIVDAENAAEMARLMRQEHLLTRMMGGPLPEIADLSQITQVLDVACGTGGWLFDLVAHYPRMRGVGIDNSILMMNYASYLVKEIENPPDLQFQVMDATQPLSFADSTFDLVNGRLLTGFLTKELWSSLLKECARITRKGGIIRLTDAEWNFTTSPALSTYKHLCTQAVYRAGHSFSPHGDTFGTTPVLRLLLQQAGYQNIELRPYVIDASAGTEAHAGTVQNYLVFYKLLQPFLLQMQVASQEDLDRTFAQMEEEVQAKDFCCLDYYLTVWGYKF
ncbi:class I SAM-dependent methyltransferase [Ktedonosporobacter rubrisoli]|uniref:Class I SAM-dependent methyltransferase n=1 Tax=Ktedonosporobacter rubrisoli TaxID=2509675 RepID=A0A4P6JHV0_KTERU|nr:class I SAM-dependent methyltransferase [Ktedonosporobacter rubrisoli]QBD74614.1 class I SAM-dependent methyltransferase [Ktedonosporobacter rubrisoli]